jgi:hypothetical protein
MKNDEDIKELLNRLSDATREPVPPTLAEDIKHQIPDRLPPHRVGKDTINIIIHLKINKIAAAAAIIITILICGTILDSRDSGAGVLRDGMMFIKYWATAGNADVSALKLRYDRLRGRGEDVVWYGDRAAKRSSAVLMQRKLPDGDYEVMFVDGHERHVSAEELIQLLSEMLREGAK